MSTDNKTLADECNCPNGRAEHMPTCASLRATLADVQPGGTVRLGDAPWPEIDAILADAYSAGAEGLPFEGIARRAAVRKAVAVLSAQPSPGGQGDELPALPHPNYPISKTGLQNNLYTASQMQDYARTALASRQPVDFNDEELQFYREHIGNDLDNALMLAGVFEVNHEGGYEACWANSMEALKRLIARQPVGISTDTLRELADRWASDRSYDGSLVDDIRALIDAPTPASQLEGKEPVLATDAMVEAALQSTVANNASPWRQAVVPEDHADFISDMRSAINAALAARPSPLTFEETTTSTQKVPDHCDRIFWQHNYYQLPVGPTDHKKPTKRRQAAVETVMNLGYLWRNDAWIAPPAQAVDLGQSVGMAELDQILLDPENQPSQFGTVPTELLEKCEEMISDLVHQFGDRGCTCTFPEADCCAYARAEHYSRDGAAHG